MGIFGDIFKDFSEIGSPISKVSGKIVDLSKLLTSYSFGESDYSSELTKQKIIVAFNELLECANKCSKFDRVRIYYPSQTLNPTIPVILKAAEYWVEVVVEQRRHFTNSLSVQLVERAENDLKIQSQKSISEVKVSSDALSSKLPNFIESMNQMAAITPNFFCSLDSSEKIEYKAPILTYGRIMGNNFYTVLKINESLYLLYIRVEGQKGQEITSQKKAFQNDLPLKGYNGVLTSLIMELMYNPKYLEITRL